MSESAAPLQWAACQCCDRTFPVTSMVNFRHEPAEHICTVCIHWLYSQSRPITRRILSYRIPLGPRIRGWITRKLDVREACPADRDA